MKIYKMIFSSIIGLLLTAFVASGYVEASQGALWAWGWNYYGQLGDGTTTDKSSPTQIGTDTNWSSVSAGALHTVAIKTDGTLWAWGRNNDGQLGDGTTTDRYSPTQIGTDTNWSSVSAGLVHTVAIKTDGTLWAWGFNIDGRLGDGTTTTRYSPTQIGTDNNWSSVSAGGYHTVAMKTDGTLWAWGNNWGGQLGDGTTTDRYSPTQIGTDTNWAFVSAGGYHTVAIKTDGTLWAWGWNYYGQLGDGTTTDKSSPTQIGTDTNWLSVFTGWDHTVAIKTGGTLWVWGSNDYGQLGDGTTIDKLSPLQIGTDVNWSFVSAGRWHTVAIKTDRTLWAWGSNWGGQLGDGTTIDKLSPLQIGTDVDWSFVSAGSWYTVAIKIYSIIPPFTVCPSGCGYTTIQSAINAASNGDTISVSPGTYTENINFNGKLITVKSAKGAGQTIINGGGLGTVVTFASGEGANSVLDGFTITGGSATQGGGIYINNSSPVIKNNIITGNSAITTGGQWDGYGGGIRIGGYPFGTSSPIIANNTITGNTAATDGGSISAYNSNLTIINNILWNNGTELSISSSTAVISYNIIQGGYPGTGNINADPLFLDPANGDYRLQPTSPAIDTGMNTSATAYGTVTDDIEGTTRPQDGDALGAGTTGDGSDYDIGAYEYKPSAPPVQFTLTITKADTGSGTVTSSPAGIDCGSDCSEAYNSGTVVNLTPTPDTGSFFTGWSGDADCSDGVVAMDADKTCTALFTLNAYNLNVTINPSAGGTVTAPGINCPADCTESYNYNTPVTLTAAANTGYTFTDWTGCDTPSGNQCTMTMNSDKSVTANFTPSQTYTLAIGKSGEGSVTVVSSPTGINCGADCQEAYGVNTIVTLTVTPENGTIFTGWAGDADCSDGVVTVDAAKTCWATFTKPRLAINKSGEGSVTITSSPAGINCGANCISVFDANTTITLTVTPESGTIFTGWAGDADCSDGVVTMDSPNMKTCWATFTKPTLSIAKGGSGTGTVVSSPGGIDCGGDCIEVYNANTIVILTPTPDLGSTFSYWAGNEDCSDGAVTMDSPNMKTCWAVFEPIP